MSYGYIIFNYNVFIHLNHVHVLLMFLFICTKINQIKYIQTIPINFPCLTEGYPNSAGISPSRENNYSDRNTTYQVFIVIRLIEASPYKMQHI